MGASPGKPQRPASLPPLPSFGRVAPERASAFRPAQSEGVEQPSDRDCPHLSTLFPISAFFLSPEGAASLGKAQGEGVER